MKLLIKLFTIFLLSFLSAHAQTVPASNNLSSSDFCKVLNSADIYSVPNITKIQNYLQNSFFPKVIANGLNDDQYKLYIGKYQLAFGIKPTGYLNDSTLKMLREQSKCFDLEKKMQGLETGVRTRKISNDELLKIILKNNVVGWDGEGGTTSITITAVPFLNFTGAQETIFIPISPVSTPAVQVTETATVEEETTTQDASSTTENDSTQNVDVTATEDTGYYEDQSTTETTTEDETDYFDFGVW